MAETPKLGCPGPPSALREGPKRPSWGAQGGLGPDVEVRKPAGTRRNGQCASPGGSPWIPFREILRFPIEKL